MYARRATDLLAGRRNRWIARCAVHEFFDSRPHPLPVRPFPKYPPAHIASDKTCVPFEHAFRHTIAHFVRTRATQRRIAHQAQAERADVLRESEPRCDFAPLRIGLQRAHVAAVDERAALQQFAIAREHHAMFGQRKLLDFLVGKMIVVAGIETG